MTAGAAMHDHLPRAQHCEDFLEDSEGERNALGNRPPTGRSGNRQVLGDKRFQGRKGKARLFQGSRLGGTELLVGEKASSHDSPLYCASAVCINPLPDGPTDRADGLHPTAGSSLNH